MKKEFSILLIGGTVASAVKALSNFLSSGKQMACKLVSGCVGACLGSCGGIGSSWVARKLEAHKQRNGVFDQGALQYVNKQTRTQGSFLLLFKPCRDCR